MNLNESLPAELADLERRLEQRNEQDESAAMRERVLGAMSAELQRNKKSAVIGWQLAAIAAGLVMILNLSMSVASVNEFSFSPAPSSDQLAAEIQAIGMIETQLGQKLR